LECSFRLYTVRAILPRGLPVERTASYPLGGVNFYCPLSLAIEKSSGWISIPRREPPVLPFSYRFHCPPLSLSIARMPRQRIGARVAIRGGAASSPARNGCRDNTFVLGERRATSCLLFRPRSVLSVYSETSASHETVCLCPLSLHPSPMRRIAIPPLAPCAFRAPVFIYPSVRLGAPLHSRPSVSLSRHPLGISLPRRARTPLFLFYKIDRTGETEETRSVGRNARI